MNVVMQWNSGKTELTSLLFSSINYIDIQDILIPNYKKVLK